MKKIATPGTLAFGAEVKRLRILAGMSRLELCDAVVASRSYLGEVETGKTRCRRDFAMRLDKGLNTGTALAEAWDRLLAQSGYPTYFMDFAGTEVAAALLRSFQAFVIYGLLQTPAYARALLTSEEAVAKRMERQEILTRTDPPTLAVVLAESILYGEVGDRAVMHEQLDHLLTVSRRPNVSLQIAPTGYYRGVHGSFIVATQPNGDENVHMVTLTGGTVSNEPGDIVEAVRCFMLLQARALSPEASRDLIRKVMEERYG